MWGSRGPSISVPIPDPVRCRQPCPAAQLRGNVLLMSGSGFVMSPSDEVRITIKGLPGSRFGGDAPGYFHPDDLEIGQALQVPVGDFDLPCFVVNGGTPVDISAVSWSHIKATFGE